MADMIPTVNGCKTKLLLESLICINSMLTHFQNIAKIMKESNLDTKSHSGHFEELNHAFKEMFAELHEIEPVTMFHVNPYSTVGYSFFIKDHHHHVPEGLGMFSLPLYQIYQRYLRSKYWKVRTRLLEQQKTQTLKA